MRFYLCLALLAVLNIFSASGLEIEVEERFKNYLFIHEDGFDSEFQDDLIKHVEPKVILRCPNVICFLEGQLSEGLKQYPRYGPQRYTHIFYKVRSSYIIDNWKELYSRMTMTKSKRSFFEHAVNYPKYPLYTPEIFKVDYWRSQWNQDEFVINESHQLIYDNLHEQENLPTRLQKSVQIPPTIHNYGALLYSALSGWGGSRCKYYNLNEQLYSLTNEFNAYDMLFCDVFAYYNLTFIANYNFAEYRWTRNLLLRDDLIISFLPDPNAVFYGSPGITFIVLKEPPILWDNIFRPFSYYLWGAIGASSTFVTIVSLAFTKIVDNLRSKIMISRLFEISPGIQMGTSTERVWIIAVRIFKFIITASYGGMILAGILDPSYPWSPSTFKELNKTSNFIATVAYDSAVASETLMYSFKLNGIGTWRDRVRSVPGKYLIEDDEDEPNRYALLMYDDKKNHYIYGKNQLYITANYTHRLEAQKEVVLKEMRYMSVPPAATKLHFLIDGIKRCFETGSWMKWKYLEDNYFKYVAPNTMRHYGVHWFDKQPRLRSLNKLDILTTVYVWGVGMVVSGIVILIELHIMGVYIWSMIFNGVVQVIGFGIWIIIKLFFGLGYLGYKLQSCRVCFLSLNRIDSTSVTEY